MPVKAIHIEDEESWQFTIKTFGPKKLGITLLGGAESLEDAEKLIEENRDSEKVLVITDGRIRGGKGSDVVELVANRNSGILGDEWRSDSRRWSVIGLASERGDVGSADFFIDKGANDALTELRMAITQIYGE